VSLGSALSHLLGDAQTGCFQQMSGWDGVKGHGAMTGRVPLALDTSRAVRVQALTPGLLFCDTGSHYMAQAGLDLSITGVTSIFVQLERETQVPITFTPSATSGPPHWLFLQAGTLFLRLLPEALPCRCGAGAWAQGPGLPPAPWLCHLESGAALSVPHFPCP
jgi:hypothetical protein